ncbi:MAG: diacylglycerol kinase family lipid kinase [Anaerolineae bacterium]|nr:diacylglycerol kinase family lipid kinase [Anaerolineae bacterium]
MPTLIILNPHAAGGRARRVWSRLEPLLHEALGDIFVAITEHPQEVAARLDEVLDLGLDRVIVIGGDGTNHSVVNALAALAREQPELPLPALGMLPVGTGRDWARTLGIPLAPDEAIQWLAQATPIRTDLGRLTHLSGTEHFLNIASAGISGEIDRMVNDIRRRRPWTFYTQTVRALLNYQPRPLRVFLDNALWYEGKAFAVAIANGRYFGHGMYFAPEAQIDDGLFDVVLVEAMGRIEAVRALSTLYDGSHLLREDVHHARATVVRIESPGGPLDLDLDGEYSTGHGLTFAVEPGLIHVLRQPSTEK